MSLYRTESDDSFEDFLEWRRWKREGGKQGEATVTAPAPQQQQTRSIAAAPAVVAVPAARVDDKGKGEASGAASPAVATAVVPLAGSQKSAVPVAAGIAPVPKAAGATSDKEAAELQTAGEAWVAEFNAASDKAKKELRNKVTNSTKAILEQGWYKVSESSTPVELDVRGAGSGRTVYQGTETFSKPPPAHSTTAHFVKADAIDTALFLIEKKGVNPLLVIPVDPKNPGEGFPGTGSLEEQAYRRTTLWSAIDGDHKTGDYEYAVPEKGCIYLPNVAVFRDCESKNGYQFLKAPRKLALCLASSVPKPPYEQKGKNFILNAEAKELYISKIRTILNAGIAKGHDAIVFTAFGCGYNATPPQAVAAVIRDLITKEFAQTYNHITFAIIDDENCGKAHNLNGNLMAFQAEFLLMEKGAAGGCCKK